METLETTAATDEFGRTFVEEDKNTYEITREETRFYINANNGSIARITDDLNNGGLRVKIPGYDEVLNIICPKFIFDGNRVCVTACLREGLRDGCCCYHPEKCATVNPDLCDNVKMGFKSGVRTSKYNHFKR